MIAPREADREVRALETLARVVVEDAEAACRRAEDRALNESRRLVLEAEDRIADLDRAARALGRTRGEAAETAEAQAAAGEVAALGAGAFDALFERFERRVLLALRALPNEPAPYEAALGVWAQRAAAAMDGPVEVFAGKRDRAAVYAALLATAAEDFHVRIEHRVHVGFVVRDLDGRVVFDARPEALVRAQDAALRDLLRKAVPHAPELPEAPIVDAPIPEAEAPGVEDVVPADRVP